jgi:large subunit ribosomal protein L2
MGKRIISRARGHGSMVYRVRRRGYSHKLTYPTGEGKAKIIKLIHSPGHSAPLAKIRLDDKIFYNAAHKNAYESQEISIGKSGKINDGDIIKLKDLNVGMRIYNIELTPGGSGKLIRSAGSFAEVLRVEKDRVFLLMPSKKTIEVNNECRATIGTIAGSGRKEKPWVKAGRKFHAMKARGKRWHFTSAVKTNAIDHPFGGGRGKRIKSKIAKRNAPPGAKVGHLRPRRTGHRN